MTYEASSASETSSSWARLRERSSLVSAAFFLTVSILVCSALARGSPVDCSDGARAAITTTRATTSVQTVMRSFLTAGLPDDLECTLPARFRNKVFHQLRDLLRKTLVLRVIAVRLIRPVDNERLAHNVFAGNESPVTA